MEVLRDSVKTLHGRYLSLAQSRARSETID
jgi:hypothetical protein